LGLFAGFREAASDQFEIEAPGFHRGQDYAFPGRSHRLNPARGAFGYHLEKMGLSLKYPL
jgi:hypothetical protein